MRSNCAFGTSKQLAVAQGHNRRAALLPQQPAGFTHQLAVLDLGDQPGSALCLDA